MSGPARELARRLSEDAESVCRCFLFNGRRCGNYWLIGDINNTPGRSLFVRLKGDANGRGAAGKWVDAATGEHGDLLDIIGIRCGSSGFGEVLDEARRFSNSPRSDPRPSPHNHLQSSPTG